MASATFCQATGRSETNLPEQDAIGPSLVDDLRKALLRGELEVFYQPIVDAASLEIACFEALLRWNHPTRGRLPPDVFIPLAEEARLIEPIGAWVLRQACAQCAAWPSYIKVAVNVSAVQLKDRQLPEIVTGALVATRLAAERLELEITETAPLSSDDGSLDVLSRLRALGVLIAMDDFGKGYATLSSLAKFPFDKVKIDRSFLQNSPATNGPGGMLKALAAMARTLEIATTVEGVETALQVAKVRVLGCREMQGFIFGGPMPAHEASDLVTRQPAGRRAPELAACLSNDGRVASKVVVPFSRTSIFWRHSGHDRSIV